jgi:hypothetical protein
MATAQQIQAALSQVDDLTSLINELYEALGKKAQATQWRQKVTSADQSKP